MCGSTNPNLHQTQAEMVVHAYKDLIKEQNSPAQTHISHHAFSSFHSDLIKCLLKYKVEVTMSKKHTSEVSVGIIVLNDLSSRRFRTTTSCGCRLQSPIRFSIFF